MTINFEKEVLNLIDDKNTVKLLATVDQDGIPHAVQKQSLYITGDGYLAYLELLETSQTNKNMVSSIWFNQKVTILLSGIGGVSYQIKGRPIKAIISGPVFEKQYIKVGEKLGDSDLAAIWIIEPEHISNQSSSAQKTHEEDAHPFIRHLDRLAK